MSAFADLRIGVLALQGAFVEHARMVRACGARAEEIRKPLSCGAAAGLDAFADRGLVAAKDDKTLMSAFVKAMSGHRIWEREKKLGDFAA